MAGVLLDSGGVEASGVFLGVLQEDMVDTVRRVKKPFIDVYIKAMFFEDANYPLTYVPMFNMVLPLKKGQKVWVQFNQQNHRYPVLWKLAAELDEHYTEERFGLPSDGQLVSFPTTEDTLDVHKFSDDMWFIGTKSYGVIHWGEQCILLNGDSVIANAGTLAALADTIKLDVKDKLIAEVMNDVTLKIRSAAKFEIKNALGSLGPVMSEALEALSMGMTVGSPTTQAFSPDLIAKMIKAKIIWDLVIQ